MSQPRFSRLRVSTEFELGRNPSESIYDELDRTYLMDIFALDGTEDEDGIPGDSKVGSFEVCLLRFDVALNLNQSPELVADAQSRLILDICEMVSSELEHSDMGGGTHIATLLVRNIDLPGDLQGTQLELDAIRAGLIGMSTGVSRAFLVLPSAMTTSPQSLNAAALRYAPLGFKPAELGSDLLWLDLELAQFWCD